MKLYIHVTNPIDAAKGDLGSCLKILSIKDMSECGWIFIDEFKQELDIDAALMTQKAVEAIDKEKEKVKQELGAKMEVLERKKSELLAITHEVKE